MNVCSISHSETMHDDFFQLAESFYQDDPYWLGESQKYDTTAIFQTNPYFQQIKTKSWGMEHEARSSFLSQKHKKR